MNDRFIIMKNFDDVVVLFRDVYGIYLKAVTFHADAWGTDAISAATEYVEQKIKHNKEIAEEYTKRIEKVTTE